MALQFVHARRSGVAPHAGAWIEIKRVAAWGGLSSRRAPMRARGLKYVGELRQARHDESRPIRARGLQSEIHRQEEPPHMSLPTRA